MSGLPRLRARSMTFEEPRLTAATPAPFWLNGLCAGHSEIDGPGPSSDQEHDLLSQRGVQMLVRTKVNGQWREADVWPGASLLFLLRDHLELPGSKNACEQGECGSCSIWLDGQLACSCLVLAAQANGREVRTVESLAGGEGTLHPVQKAFVEAGAVQCGFCTPGLVVAVTDLLERDPAPSQAEIREALSGNLCRCTGYTKILDAVTLAAKQMLVTAT